MVGAANADTQTRVTPIMRTSLWISFDLSIRADYAGLYAWLDAHDAKECGDSVAFLKFEHEKPMPDGLDQLREDLLHALGDTPRTRVYVVCSLPAGRTLGRFIIGGRKAP